MKVKLRKTYWLEKNEVRYLRYNYTLKEMAYKLGCSKSYVCDILNIKRPVSARFIKKVNNLLEEY